MRRLAYLISFSLVAMLVLVPAAMAQQTVTVSMEDNFFEPASITVEPGTTVTWVQNGSNPHTTTSYDGLWDSGMMAGGSGATASYTFNEPGTFEYFCIPHEDQGMVGTVTVTGGGAAAQAGGATAQAGGAATDQYAAEPLPTTSGPGFVLPVALALMVAGIMGLTFVMRRRIQ